MQKVRSFFIIRWVADKLRNVKSERRAACQHKGIMTSVQSRTVSGWRNRRAHYLKHYDLEGTMAAFLHYPLNFDIRVNKSYALIQTSPFRNCKPSARSHILGVIDYTSTAWINLCHERLVPHGMTGTQLFSTVLIQRFRHKAKSKAQTQFIRRHST